MYQTVLTYICIFYLSNMFLWESPECIKQKPVTALIVKLVLIIKYLATGIIGGLLKKKKYMNELSGFYLRKLRIK